MNIKKNIAVTILTTSFLISGISNPIGYNVSAFRPIEVNAVLTLFSKNSPILFRWWDELPNKAKQQKNTCSCSGFVLYYTQSKRGKD